MFLGTKAFSGSLAPEGSGLKSPVDKRGSSSPPSQSAMAPLPMAVSRQASCLCALTSGLQPCLTFPWKTGWRLCYWVCPSWAGDSRPEPRRQGPQAAGVTLSSSYQEASGLRGLAPSPGHGVRVHTKSSRGHSVLYSCACVLGEEAGELWEQCQLAHLRDMQKARKVHLGQSPVSSEFILETRLTSGQALGPIEYARNENREGEGKVFRPEMGRKHTIENHRLEAGSPDAFSQMRVGSMKAK